MKLSISWIFDHINADWRKQDIDLIVSKFNKISAEIEDYYKVKFNLDKFAVAKVIDQNNKNVKLSIPEWKKEIELPKRLGGSVFMVTNKDENIRFATLNDFNLLKDGFIPALNIAKNDLSGRWKKNFEDEDIILEVDNKSITNRPDMWGHRGFAREIAAFMDLEFLPESKFLVEKKVFNFNRIAKSTKTNPISIEIKGDKACNRFAGIYIDNIQNQPSNPFIVSRLLKVGVRPINLLIDITNYLTLDWSQPIHAYDTSVIEGDKIIARMAKKDEKLKLLNESELTLTDQDLVIADTQKPLCLGGIMGGLYSGINKNTRSLLIESANFDPTYIRKSALRHKVRTESSMRFEKTLDKNQNIQGVLRFLKLLNDYNVNYHASDEILSVGVPAKEINMKISHEFLERRSGIKLHDYDITVPLTKLGFKVQQEKVENESGPKSDIIYSINVPTFRSSKDVEIKEDILEEIIRFYGFDNIKLELPSLKMEPKDLTATFRVREIKKFLVNSAHMTEQQNYVFYNDNFLKSINFKPKNIAASVINPVSVDQTKLITSLMPGLFKNLQDNFVHQDSLRFFEFGRVWLNGPKNEIIEKKMLSGLFFEKRKKIDFYDIKSYIIDLLNLLGIDFKNTEWKKVEKPQDIWAMPYQTAQIFFKGKRIGTLGRIEPTFLSKLDVLPESDGIFFELDGDFLINYKKELKKFKPFAKYQETTFDLSLFIPLNLNTSDLEKKLLHVDNLISKVNLIDFFEKKDWADKRSVTFRLTISDPEKTLQKDVIDDIWKRSIEKAESFGAKLRD